MGKRVFISYSHQDSVCAKGIARFLTRQGYDVWIDVDKLVVGQSWPIISMKHCRQQT